MLLKKHNVSEIAYEYTHEIAIFIQDMESCKDFALFSVT